MLSTAQLQMDDIYTIPVTDMHGNITNLNTYRGKACLIVNVASRCGFTSQYKALEAFYQRHLDDLMVLGFPCNQFLHQEPGNHEQIKRFVESCFRVTFPIFGKIDVRGPNQAPIYAYIATHLLQKTILPIIPWNFTKILVDKQGKVCKRYLPTTSFKVIENDLNRMLAASHTQHPDQ